MTVNETLTNMCMVPPNKNNVAKYVDVVSIPEIDVAINQPNSTNTANTAENKCCQPKINVFDMNYNKNKSLSTNTTSYSNKERTSNVPHTTLCTYTPSNDFVYQNDRPHEPSGSNQTMDYMSSKFLNDNLYQASFFTFSPSKNRIVYSNRPTIQQ
jgi:hypothetical protein